MKRKQALMCAGAGLLLSLLLIWSFAGAMVGIYVCPSAAILDGSHCYLVKRGKTWSLVNIRGNLGDRAYSLRADQIEISAGWWTATIVNRSEGSRMTAFAPYNLIDVADVVFGSRRDLGR